ncbi:hypothetical protein EGM51_12345 [Verrucomicrobia bacterium S94]|nr:hypothetical protein EGM51_12345 [Verrucomicrobia bacterium S94]
MKKRIERYRDTDVAKEWLSQNKALVQRLFETASIRDFVFEPFKKVFQVQSDTERQILATITQVSIANAVLAGLPGKLGIGVFVSMALEAWMAFSVARHVGIRIKDVNDIWKYFGLLAGTAVIILYIFRMLLNGAFALLSLIPGAFAVTVMSELIVTNFVGLLFWTGFEEVQRAGSFRIPQGALGRLIARFKKLIKFQMKFIKKLGDPKNIRLVGGRLKSWLMGEIAVYDPAIRGEVFSFAAMATLVSGNTDQLNGPLGDVFLDSIRRAYSKQLGDASVEEIQAYFEGRTPDQLAGDVNLVKGEMFEQLIEHRENFDGDVIVAALHEDRTFPGSDIVFTNLESGQEIAVSLKAAADPSLIEHALMRYPDIPILTTHEMQEYFGDHPMVDFSTYSEAELEKVTEDNFDRLVDQLPEFDALHVASGGVAAKTASSLWPFTVAYLRRRITKDQLTQAMTRVLGESGISLSSRIIWGAALGPVFVWYLLARSIFMITNPFMTDEQDLDEQGIA